jgi:transposase InsO family protein
MWWPRIDSEIEEKIGTCSICNVFRSAPPRAPLAPWPYPARAWERVHLDLFSWQSKQFLVAIDAHSKWVKCFLLTTTDSNAIIDKLCELLRRYDLVRTLVTDNASNFYSSQFVGFCSVNGMQHVTIAPYHPASNGQAENSVKTVKRAV